MEIIKSYLMEEYANPPSTYRFAGKTHGKVEDARRSIAEFLGAKSNEVFLQAEEVNLIVCKDGGKLYTIFM